MDPGGARRRGRRRDRAGGRLGRAEAPDIDFGRILARLIRYFHQPKEYWLANCTLHDWREIYSRELLETPPADALVAAYLDYKPPPTDANDVVRGDEGPELWDSGLPDVTE